MLGYWVVEIHVKISDFISVNHTSILDYQKTTKVTMKIKINVAMMQDISKLMYVRVSRN